MRGGARAAGPLLWVFGLAALYAWAEVASTFVAPGSIGTDYIAPGTDFMVFHTALRAALRGDWATLADADAFTALLNRTEAAYLPRPLQFRPWVYPPAFLALLLPLAPLGFPAALAAWWVAGPALLAVVVLSPAGAVNVVDGQGAFFVAAALVGGAALLPARPLLAGLVWGLLAAKPQFAVLAPVALLAQGDRRVAARGFAGLVLGAAALAAVSFAVFGATPWLDWVAGTRASTAETDPRWFLAGRAWGNSVYTCARLLGAARGLASGAQAVAMAAAAAAVFTAFRRQGPPGLAWQRRVAVLLAAAVLAAPHWATYDGVLLVAAVGLAGLPGGALLSGGAGRIGLLLAWVLPLAGPPILSLGGFGLTVLAAVLPFALQAGGRPADG